jgi:hypothetical protein
MPKQITSDQVVAAAEGLGKAEFTRGDLAQKLGVEEPNSSVRDFARPGGRDASTRSGTTRKAPATSA